MTDADAVPPPTVSASGEYIAVAQSGPDGRRVRLLRRGVERDSVTVFAGGTIEGMAFDPRDLRLALLADGALSLVQASSGGRTVVARDLDHGSLLWSPDGARLAFVTRGDRPAASVFDAAGGTLTGTITFTRAPVWFADSRSLTGLATAGSSGRMLGLVRRTLHADGYDEVPLFPLSVAATRFEGPAWSPDGRRAAIRLENIREMPDGFPASSFLDPLFVIRTAAFPVPDSARYDPPEEDLDEFAWHPSGRWYLARQDFEEGGGLWLHDVLTGDAQRIGSAGATRPAFSPDGSRMLWIERTPDGDRFAFLDLRTVHENLPRSRSFAAEGAAALAAADWESAARAYRNALRLAPGAPRSLQGLGRAYLRAAFDGPFTDARGADLEAATIAYLAAWDADRGAADLRVDFLDAMGRLAWIRGQDAAPDLADRARRLIAGEGPCCNDPVRDAYPRAREALVDARLWDPENRLAQVLLDGLMARYGDLMP